MRGLQPGGSVIAALIEESMGPGEHAMGAKELGIPRHGLLEQSDCLKMARIVRLQAEEDRFLIKFVRHQVARGGARHGRIFARGDFRLEQPGDGLGNFALHRKKLRDLALVFLGPKMGLCPRLDQLRFDAQVVAFPLHAAFEEMGDPEFLADLARVARFAGLVETGRGAADHFQVGDSGQIGENFFLHAGGEVGVVRVLTQVFERQDGDAFFGRRKIRFLVSLPGESERQGQAQPEKEQGRGGESPAPGRGE